MINKRDYILILLLGMVLFIPFLGRVHLFDWDEINFAESAREMLLTGDYFRVQINFKPFWEKPPLFIWLQALSMSIFGVNEFAARLPNALVGIATLMVLFYIGNKTLDRKFGWIWVMAYAGSWLPHLYFKSGIIDPLFNLFIFLGVYQLYRLTTKQTEYNKNELTKISALAGLFTGLGILTKGPVAMLMVLLSLAVFWASRRFRKVISIKDFIIFLIVSGMVSFAWFGVETLKNGPWFLVTFIQYQIRLLTTADAGHGGPFYYHFVVLLLGVFPASVFIFRKLSKTAETSLKGIELKLWMVILLAVVLVVFSIVKTKIVHYSSLAYFPLTFLAAYHIHRLIITGNRPSGLSLMLFLIIGLAYAGAFILLPYVGTHLPDFEHLIKDPFAKLAIHADAGWTGYESIIGWGYLAVVVLGFILLIRKRLMESFALMFVATAISMQFILVFVVPKIETYSQRAAIEFYKEKSGQDVYVDVMGFKSYAQLFYFDKPIPQEDSLNLVFSPVDKPVFFVAKANNAEQYQKDYNLKKVGEKNGFVFLKRK